MLGFFLQICFVVKLPTEILWTWELRIEIDECLASPVPIIDSDCVQMESFNFFFFSVPISIYTGSCCLSLGVKVTNFTVPTREGGK